MPKIKVFSSLVFTYHQPACTFYRWDLLLVPTCWWTPTLYCSPLPKRERERDRIIRHSPKKINEKPNNFEARNEKVAARKQNEWNFKARNQIIETQRFFEPKKRQEEKNPD